MRLLHDFQRTVCRRRVFDTDGYTNTNLNIGVLNREMIKDNVTHTMDVN